MPSRSEIAAPIADCSKPISNRVSAMRRTRSAATRSVSSNIVPATFVTVPSVSTSGSARRRTHRTVESGRMIRNSRSQGTPPRNGVAPLRLSIGSVVGM